MSNEIADPEALRYNALTNLKPDYRKCFASLFGTDLKVALQRAKVIVTANFLDVAQGDIRARHLIEGSAAEAVGTDSFQVNAQCSNTQDFIGGVTGEAFGYSPNSWEHGARFGVVGSKEGG